MFIKSQEFSESVLQRIISIMIWSLGFGGGFSQIIKHIFFIVFIRVNSWLVHS